jgi:aminoglycoside phosphotransferase (APT) family kinase protein
MLHDDQVRTSVSAAPRKGGTFGRADLGGRMRVARILQSAGVDSTLSPMRIAGSSNEVWQAGDFVIRVGFHTGAERLRRESRLAELLPANVRYPEVVASGVESFGEWIVVHHVPGVPLSEAWGNMQPEQRRSVTHDLASIMRSLHSVVIAPDDDHDLAFHEGEGDLALPHQLPSSRILELLEQARWMHGMDRSIIDQVTERVLAVRDAIGEHERAGLVHGDLHFENILVHNGRISAVLDFEWSRPGPREVDVDVLARFCFDPSMHIGGSYAINAVDFKDVLKWVHQEYPELFAADDFRDRLFLSALSFDVPWLLRMVPNGPGASLPKWHPLNQIRDLLILGTHAERLGWGE